MQPRISILAFLLLTLLLASASQARDVGGTDGPAVGLAVGADGGGFYGGFLAYYLTWPAKRLGLMPHAGVGAAFYREASPAFSLGIGGSFGRRHRLVVDLQVTGVSAQSLTLYGERLDAKPIYGLGFLVGWEWLSRSGFFMRGNLGPAFAFLPDLYQRSEALEVTFNLLSAGVKVW